VLSCGSGITLVIYGASTDVPLVAVVGVMWC
jgi:hypothetical protein